MLEESQRRELVRKLAYKSWELRSNELDNDGECNPLYGYGDSDSDYRYACRVVEFFEQESVMNDKSDYEDYTGLFADILKQYGVIKY